MSEGGNISAGRGPRGHFSKGFSGNPNGRRPGVLDQRSRWRRLLEKEGEELISKIVSLAKGGDREALQFCVSRLIAPAREPLEPVSVRVTPGSTIFDKIKAVTDGALSGLISPAAAAALLRLLEAELNLTGPEVPTPLVNGDDEAMRNERIDADAQRKNETIHAAYLKMVRRQIEDEMR